MIHVCFSSDNNYAKHMAAAMASVISNSNDDVCFYILDGGISQEYKDKLQELKTLSDRQVSIDLLDIPKEPFADFPVHGWAQATYYRYLISSLVKADRVLYLDCDIIVAADLAELWNINLDGYYLAGVKDCIWQKHCERTGLHDYVNAGVLLINNALWRADNIERKLFEFTANNIERLQYQDQDVINNVCQGKIKILSQIWNCPTTRHKREDANIYHFIGSKPWGINAKTIYRDLYWKYFLMTPWKKEYTICVKFLQKLNDIRVKIKQIFAR